MHAIARLAASRIAIAFKNRMTMTLEEITAHENQLLAQIAQSQQLLASYRRVRAEHEQSLLAPAPEPAMSPAKLALLNKGYGGGIRLATWAIRQMTGDFTVRHIAAALRQAGHPRRIERLSVILNRMKADGKITEVMRGRGRTPSTFRATAAITARPLEYCARHSVDRPRGTFRPGVFC